jgi:hypothetical protein
MNEKKLCLYAPSREKGKGSLKGTRHRYRRFREGFKLGTCTASGDPQHNIRLSSSGKYSAGLKRE